MSHPHNINCLPAELLLSIFQLIGTHDGPCTLPGIVAASHVCKRWRYLALQTQSLWTVISISNREKDYAHHARVWLARSGVLPVDLTIHWDSSWVEREAEEALFPIDDAAPWADETSQYIRRSYMEYERFRDLKRQSLMRELECHKHRWRSFKWNATSHHLFEGSVDADVQTLVDASDHIHGMDSNSAIYMTVSRDFPSLPSIDKVSLDSKASVRTGKNSFFTRNTTSMRRFWSKFWDLLHF
ncbi:uncharacterized protein EDB93DRAFT_603992 [Suillus bovinus]|uniref:uncharacterized protein n=1 Tax=Suillus bovinus TaxID=48563 RepID=UPI001B885EC1|nr:uncharacterized protein EDB93DRAFT_603992 [Suillus bovinus]KAG2142795.1 hypothetical protein EDB93DRAFT_603992 [Suillus bovinus]